MTECESIKCPHHVRCSERLTALEVASKGDREFLTERINVQDEKVKLAKEDMERRLQGLNHVEQKIVEARDSVSKDLTTQADFLLSKINANKELRSAEHSAYVREVDNKFAEIRRDIETKVADVKEAAGIKNILSATHEGINKGEKRWSDYILTVGISFVVFLILHYFFKI